MPLLQLESSSILEIGQTIKKYNTCHLVVCETASPSQRVSKGSAVSSRRVLSRSFHLPKWGFANAFDISTMEVALEKPW